MRKPLTRLTSGLASLLGLAAAPAALSAQKALVYCPAADTRGCDAIAAALTASFPDGVDRASDVGTGVDLRTADLFQYAVFVVPSLADGSASQPYAFLRDATVAHKLKDALMGRHLFYSGTPDQGSTNRDQKNALLVNLARTAASNFAAAKGPGLVVLQDFTETATARYDWLRAITGVNLTADPALMSYASVRAVTATGTGVLTSGGGLIAYANMAGYGFQLPTGAAGVTLDAIGQTGTTQGGQVVLASMQGVSATGAVVMTDKDDYAPGTTVVMTGAGFQAGETVTLSLHEDPEVHTIRTFTATADGAGKFTFTGFSPEAHDVGVRFILTATGNASGFKAQTTFTDAVNTATVPKFFVVGGSPSAPSCTTTPIAQPTAGTRVCASSDIGANSGNATNNYVEFLWFAPGQSTPAFTQRYPSAPLTLPAGGSTTATSIQTPNASGDWTVKVCQANSGCSNNPTTLSQAALTVASATEQTTVSGVSATASTFGGTTTLSAKVSPANSPGSVAFYLNGSTTPATGTQSYDATTGIATLSNVTHGLNATQTGFSVRAVFTPTNSSAYTASEATNATALLVSQAKPTIALTWANSTYSGQPNAATAVVNGIGGTAISGATATLAYYSGSTASGTALSGAPSNGGTYTVKASYAGAGNYSAADDQTATITIAPATPAFSNLVATAITYGDAAASVTGKLAAGTLIPQGGTVKVAIGAQGSSLSSTATVAADGSFAASFANPNLSANTDGYPITVSFDATGNFAAASDGSKKLVVNPKALTLTLGNLGATYDGQPKAATVNGAPQGVAVSVTYNGSTTPPTNAGDYAVVATVTDGNYTGSASGTLKIAKATATLSLGGLAATYNGSPIGATVTTNPAELSGVAVTYDGSATVPTNAGSYAVVAKLTNGNYEATDATGTLVIGKAAATITLGGLTHTFDGSAKSATFTVSPAAATGVTLAYKQGGQTVAAPTNAGSYDVVATLSNTNYQATEATGTLTIAQASQSITFGTLAAKTYGDAPFTVTATGGGSGSPVTFTVAGKCTISGAMVTITGAGSCTVTAAQAGNPNYLPATDVPQTFTIAKATQQIVWATPSPVTYGTALSGTQLNAQVTGVAGGSAPGALTYSPASGAVLDAGAQTLSVGAAETDDYKPATATVTLTVNKADQTISWNAPAAITYGTPLGDAQLNATAAGVAGGSPAGALTYTPAAGQLLGAGTQTLSVSAAATTNYNAATKTVTLTVNKATPTITLTWNGGTYNASPFAATAPVTGVGTPAENLGAATLTYYSGSTAGGTALQGAPTNAGTYAVRASFVGSDNYVAGSADATITIAKAKQTITWATPAGIVYGTRLSSTQLNATAAGVPGGSDAGALTYSPATGALLGAGAQTLTANAAATENYESATTTVTLQVAKAEQTITWANPAAIDYGTALSATQLNATVAGVDGGSAPGALTYSPANGEVLAAGTRTLTVNAAGTDNYNPKSATVQLTVNKVALTVTPGNATRRYGAANPEFTGTVTGVVNNDGITALYETAATPTSPVASYPITATLKDPNHRADNYNVTLNSGTLTVTKAPLTVTANSFTITYQDAAPVFTAKYDGLVNGEQSTVLGGPLVTTFTGIAPTSFGPSTTAPTNAGTYAIAPSGLTSGNYEISYAPGSYTINKKDQSITFAELEGKTYGAADFAVTGTASSQLPLAFTAGAGDKCTVAGGTVHLTGAGSCTITAAQAGDGNWNAAPSVVRTFSIAKKALTGTITAADKVYDGTATATVTPQPLPGLVGSDVVMLVAADAQFDSKNVGDRTATVSLSLSGAAKDNYTVNASATAGAKITKRPVSVTADAKTKVYGEADPALSYQISSGTVIQGDNFSGSLLRVAGENVGSYAIGQSTLSLGDNYQLSYTPANLTITPRPLTITAAAATKVYGSVDPSLTYSITTGNLVTGDALTGALTRATGETVAGGPYAITQGSVTAGPNYNLSYVGAALTITRKPVAPGTVTVSSKVYDATTDATIETRALVEGAKVGNDDVALTGGTAAFADANVGTAKQVSITGLALGGSTAGNYELTPTTASSKANITARPITITADAKTKVYGDADPALTYQITSGSLAGSDALAGALTRAPGQTVDTYAIQQGTVALSANYALSYTTANLVITKRPVTVTAAAKTKIEGGVDPALTYTITSGSLAYTDVFAGALTRTPGETAAGSPYPILQGDLRLTANYTLTYVGANFTITKNAAPVIGSISIKAGGAEVSGPLAKGTIVTLTGSFDDADVPESKDYKILITWDDGSTTPVTQAAPGTFTATHTYNGANVATVGVTVTDKINTSATGTMIGGYANYLVFYDPDAGFVTGGGWIDSPASACKLTSACAGVTGKANFGFNAKYKKGQSIPDGDTEFQFQAGGLNFKSTSYQWLVVAGTKAQYKGAGTINGRSGYTFLLTAIDGDLKGKGNPDSFRIKIVDGSGTVVYDNQMGAADDSDATTTLGGGSIVIHQ